MRRLKNLERFVDWTDPLHEIAIEKTGLNDFGADKAYLTGLRVLLEAQDQYCDLQVPRYYAYKLVHVLEQRLLAEQAFKANPNFLDVPITKPLVITGMVRTGSTALQYLVARDPNRQHLEYFMSERPQPRPPRDTWSEHADFLATQARIDSMYEMAPETKAMHFAAADYPEECGHLMAQTFTDEYWQIGSSVPHYNAWYETADMVPTYTQHKKLIQMIGSNEPAKPWTLKYPVHLKHLKSFLKVYPDAQVIWTHRDPASVMSSYTNMNVASRKLTVRHETIDRDDLFLEQFELWAAATDRAVEVRSAYPEAQFYDLHFEDYVADPVGKVKDAYAHFGIEWREDCEQALNQWNDENPQNKHGKHTHEQEPLSLSRKQIQERYSKYIAACGVAVK
jgi:hypothetical protein